MIKLRTAARKLHNRTDAGLAIGQPVYILSLYIEADWIDNYVELRMPEVLQSSMGMHWLDHYNLPKYWPISEPEEFPQWKTDPDTGRVSYECRLKEGLVFGGGARLAGDSVELDFFVANRTGQNLDFVEVNPCFMLMESPSFPNRDLSRFYISIGGKMASMDKLTPTSEKMSKEPWMTVLLDESRRDYNGPKVTDTWWLADQTSDKNLMAAVAADGRHLIGYTWKSRPKMLMNNFKHPCMHTGPGLIENFADGQQHTCLGRIYLIESDLDELVKRYKSDQEKWHENKQD
jgi:hypothetical protein